MRSSPEPIRPRFRDVFVISQTFLPLRPANFPLRSEEFTADMHGPMETVSVFGSGLVAV